MVKRPRMSYGDTPNRLRTELKKRNLAVVPFFSNSAVNYRLIENNEQMIKMNEMLELKHKNDALKIWPNTLLSDGKPNVARGLHKMAPLKEGRPNF